MKRAVTSARKKDFRRLLFLFLIMTAVAVAIGGTAIGLLYHTAFEEQRAHLAVLANSQARLIESIARFERDFDDYPQGPLAGVIAHVRQAYEGETGFGATGEFVIGRREGADTIVVLKSRNTGPNPVPAKPMASYLAEPMLSALSGRSGTLIARDPTGAEFLAAYAPVATLDLAVIAKIDLSEIRAPYVRAAAVVTVVALFLITFGTFVFSATSDPILKRIREGEKRFRELFENMVTGGAVYEPVGGGEDFVFKDFNGSGERINKIRREELLGRRVTEVFPGVGAFGLLDVLREVWRTGEPRSLPAAFYQDERISGWREVYVYKLPSGEIVSLFEDVTDRMQAEKNLHESEERFRSIAESANDAIVSIDTMGNVISWNRAAEKIFGYAAPEVLGATLTRMIPQRYHDAHQQGLRRMAIDGDHHVIGKTVELEGLRKDGKEIPIELSLSMWTLGEERFFTGIIRDITERKRAEKALRDSEARSRSIIEAQTIGILIVDENKEIRFANQTAETIFGYRSTDLIGAPFGHPLVKGDVAEIEIIRPDRSVTFAEMQAIPVRWDGQNQFLLFVKDVSAQRRAERDLGKLFQAVEQNPVSVVITDVDGRIEYVNPKFVEATGYTYAEVVGKNPRVLKSGETAPAEYEKLWKTISAGNVWRGEFHNKRKNGELFWELASIAPVRDARGDITHYVAVKEDITQRKETEEQLRHAQKMEVIGQFTGGIAHDFNNLLAIILGNLQLLEESATADDESRELIADAIWSAERGAELTHRLLAFARRQRLNPRVTDLNHVVGKMTDLIRRTLGAVIRIREVLAPGLWETMIDHGQLENALLNLVVNARDAMPEGGVLTIATDNAVLEQDDVTNVEDFSPGEYAMLAVSDTGTGMPPEVVERIFEPFFTTKKFGEGSGLGLSMIYGFVRQSGGHITVDSEVDRGTTVKLYLPRVSSSDGQATEFAPEVAKKMGSGEVILVVEHDKRVRRAAVNLLRKEGYEVLEASTAVDALQRVEALPRLDLLFTDVTLPDGMKGTELAKEVRHRCFETKILFTSGYAEDAMLGSGSSEKEVHFLAKPYRKGQLADKVRDILDVTEDDDAPV
jgi:PAS domain S-box-containing protein